MWVENSFMPIRPYQVHTFFNRLEVTKLSKTLATSIFCMIDGQLNPGYTAAAWCK